MKVLIAFIVFGFAGGFAPAQTPLCSPKRHAKLPAINQMTYDRARKKLLAAGWQPLQTKSFNQARTDPDFSYRNAEVFWRKGYVETEHCAGTGVAACAFLFKDAYGNKLRVTTAGEELLEHKIHASVTGFHFVCD